MARKLGKRTDQRMAMLRNQVSELLWYGEIETTVDRAKEVRRMAEKLITLAIRTYQDEVTVTKTVTGAKGEKSDVKFVNDGAKKLAARRRLMAELRDLQEMRKEKESKAAYVARIKDVNHPLIRVRPQIRCTCYRARQGWRLHPYPSHRHPPRRCGRGVHPSARLTHGTADQAAKRVLNRTRFL